MLYKIATAQIVYYVSRNTNCRCVIRDIFSYDCIRSNRDIIADRDLSNYFGPDTYEYVVSNYRTSSSVATAPLPDDNSYSYIAIGTDYHTRIHDERPRVADVQTRADFSLKRNLNTGDQSEPRMPEPRHDFQEFAEHRHPAVLSYPSATSVAEDNPKRMIENKKLNHRPNSANLIVREKVPPHILFHYIEHGIPFRTPSYSFPNQCTSAGLPRTGRGPHASDRRKTSGGWHGTSGHSCGRRASALWFNENGRSVTQHFGNAIHNFGCVVPDSDDGVRPDLLGMGEHHVEGFSPCFFAQLGKHRDVAAEYRLQIGSDSPEYRPRANRNTPYDTEMSSEESIPACKFAARGGVKLT
jgi:hypothetical protein